MTKKVKRIDAIVKCITGTITNLMERKAKRILRDLEDFASNNADDIDKAELEAEALINKLGDAATADDRVERGKIFNEYCKKMEEIERRKRYATYIETLKKKLNEEVEVEEPEK